MERGEEASEGIGKGVEAVVDLPAMFLHVPIAPNLNHDRTHAGLRAVPGQRDVGALEGRLEANTQGAKNLLSDLHQIGRSVKRIRSQADRGAGCAGVSYFVRLTLGGV